ncbi:DNA integrity scanning diadenylate cyclase DisA [Candidatus Pacearchaeota archaeon]|nr:DNA integrity scanning diadenylate cyclase DisA [Candidatus Pacearchaeota archaeon]
MAGKIETNFGILDVLKKFSPGTQIRNALDDLLKARMGALIAVDKDSLSGICSGGFRFNSKFTPQRLVELAKMDGAIILSDDLKKILQANVLLSPKIDIHSRETGTRHQAAERTARQFNTITIAVSERKNKITIFYSDERHELEDSSEILRRATETLQILEKQKEIFNESMINLNILEINNLVSINDVSKILQRIEIIKRISDIVKRYLVELGKEGIIVSMRLKELTKNISSEREMILKDYFGNKKTRADTTLQNMNFDFLIETSNISRILFEQLKEDKIISSKGKRILGKTFLLEKDAKVLMSYFNTIDKVFDASEKEMLDVFKNETFIKSLLRELRNLKDKIMSGKLV